MDVLRGLAASLLLCLLVAPAGADEGRDDLPARLAALHASGEADAFAAAVRATDADPWLLVEDLAVRGHPGAADAVARVVGGSEPKLAAYAVWRAGHPLAEAAATRWHALRRALAEGREEHVFRALGGDDLGGDGVAHAHWLATRSLRIDVPSAKPDAAMAAYREAADACTALGWTARALALHERASMRGYIRMRRKAGLAHGEAGLALARARGDTAAEGRIEGWVGLNLRGLGRHDEARAHFQRAVELAEGPDAKRGALRNLFVLEIDTDNRPALEGILLQVRALDVALRDDEGLAATDMQLASLDAMRGRLTHALDRLQDALARIEAAAEPLAKAGAYKQAGQIWLQMRDAGKALSYLDQARALFAQAGRKDGVLELLRAAALLMAERPADAESAGREAVRLLRKHTAAMRMSAHRMVAHALVVQGRFDEAAKALETSRALLGPKATAQTRMYQHAAECMLKLRAGDPDGALAAGRAALALQTPGIVGSWSALIETRMAEAWLRKGDPAAAIAHAERAAAVVLALGRTLPDRLGAQHRAELERCFALGVDAAAAAKDPAKLFAFAEQARAVALRAQLGEGEVAARALDAESRETLDRLEAAEAAAVRAYRGARAAGRHQEEAVAALQAARAASLEHREALRVRHAVTTQVLLPRADTLDTARTRLQADEAVVVFAAGSRDVHALVVTRGAVRIVDLGKRAGLATLAEGLALEDATAPPAPDLAALRRDLAKPIALPDAVRRVRVVPTGDLAWLPYAPVWPKREVVMLPSVTVGRLVAARPLTGSTAILAVAPGDTGLAPPLPGAAAEARAVGTRVVQGGAASERAVRDLLAKDEAWRAVHLACHGLMDGAHPLRSALLLHPGQGSDGLWSVSEILGARVRADLVTLSACSSARGRAFAQEGVVGFVHAFLVAGARGVLVSLWDVDDEATAAFMQRFYAAWTPGVTAAGALRAAQEAMRAEARWKHPAHWAGWQVWADG